LLHHLQLLYKLVLLLRFLLDYLVMDLLVDYFLYLQLQLVKLHHRLILPDFLHM
jgi:hypothetical protein